MADRFARFQEVARRAHEFSDETDRRGDLHPFEWFGVHEALPRRVKKLFDDGHFAEATFAAFKYLDKEVAKLAGIRKSGEKLMMEAFSEKEPKLALSDLVEDSEIDEQRGYRFLYAGGMIAIRNPRGHEYEIEDDQETCIRHLLFVTLLLTRLEEASYVLTRNAS